MAAELLQAAFRGGDPDDESMGFLLIAETMFLLRSLFKKK